MRARRARFTARASLRSAGPRFARRSLASLGLAKLRGCLFDSCLLRLCFRYMVFLSWTPFGPNAERHNSGNANIIWQHETRTYLACSTLSWRVRPLVGVFDP